MTGEMKGRENEIGQERRGEAMEGENFSFHISN